MSETIFTAEALAQIVLVFSVAFYLVECYLGYRCIKALVAIVGFLLGFVIGFGLSARIYTADYYLPAVVGILAGILLALLAFKLYLLGVFIFCGSVAAGAVSNLPLSGEGFPSVLKIILCIAAFVVVGILGVKFSKMCIIIITALSGAVSATNLLATPVAAIGENVGIRIAVIAIFAVSGIVIQRITAKKK